MPKKKKRKIRCLLCRIRVWISRISRIRRINKENTCTKSRFENERNLFLVWERFLEFHRGCSTTFPILLLLRVYTSTFPGLPTERTSLNWLNGLSKSHDSLDRFLLLHLLFRLSFSFDEMNFLDDRLRKNRCEFIELRKFNKQMLHRAQVCPSEEKEN